MRDEASASGDRVAEAHAALLKDVSLQFDRTGFTPPQTPGWLHWLGGALKALEPLLKAVFWIGLALLAALILYAIVREIMRIRAPRAKPLPPVVMDNEAWRPDARAAQDLLAEADALAARGHYADAAHLLLLRSVQDIEKRQPRALCASLTSREITRLKALPEAARPAFEQIGRVVERSLFGGADVDAREFSECRQAYEAFALPEGWRG
ncbi:DUF4129 domain-containing protein [Brevundimonas diminuta]|uniref:DUF4129 domain-containing protein n=1 Tax=Brevundimonas diminuta TaxID=293 RepID=UPI003D04732D